MTIKHLLPIFILYSISTQAQRLYLHHNAAAGGNGESWPNAYTTLQQALDSAPEGAEVWVAAGTYTPVATDGSPLATFLINKNIRLLGGFAGFEADVTARDMENNVAVLSGDLNGDDIPGDFTLNRSDNAATVVTIAAGITQETLLEGFVIRGGHAYGSEVTQNGGGIHCLGSPVIRQCRFEHNLARESGGAVYLNSAKPESAIFEDCRFENNRANDGGALYSSSSQLTLRQCAFVSNEAGAGPNQKNGGAIYSIDSYGLIEYCSFTDNFAFDFGGALFVRATPFSGGSLTFRSCTFEHNEALTDQGGGAFLYISGNDNRFQFSKCTFSGNSAGTWGGGLNIEDRQDAGNTALVLDSCYFYQNSNEIYGDGSALFVRLMGQDVEMQLTNSIFEENRNDFFAAAAIWATGWSSATGSVWVGDCTFKGNTAKHSAGLDMGSGPGIGPFHYRVTDCAFLSNHASGRGGGLTMYAESPALYEVEACRFEGNTADGQGGALWLAVSEPDLQVRVRNCVFKRNASPLGGAVLVYPLFFPATREADILIDNSLFVDNSSENDVIAGKHTGTVRISNATIVDNQAGSLMVEESASFELQNTILYNPGFEEFESRASDTALVFRSRGGNLIGDESLYGLLSATDQQNAVPFLDDDYKPAANSPAVDAGLAYEDMPAYDLAGNFRLDGGCLDIGAYESSYYSSTECQVLGARETASEIMPVLLYPNPVRDVLTVRLPESVSQPFRVEVYNAQNKLLKRLMVQNGAPLNVETLPTGIYWVKVVAEGAMYSGKLIKQ